MAITSDSIGLLFRAKGDTDDAKRAFTDLERTIGLTTGATSGLATAMPIAGVAIAGMAAAVGLAVVGLYNLTKASADYAGAVFDAKEKTGLSAATLSTLKLNADNAGSSLEAITGSAAKFARLMGEAAAGNEKAQKTLKDLKVTSSDLNTAMSQANKTIFESKEGTDQLVLAQKAYGKSGADMIPVIKQMGGDLEKATKEAERLGLVMTEKDIAAADAFGDALGTLSAQTKMAGVAFTSDLMPVLTRYFVMASEWYARNQNEVRAWGTTVALVVGDFARGFGAAMNFIQENATALRAVLAGLTFGISEMVYQAARLIGEHYKARAAATGGQGQEGQGGTGAVTPAFSAPRGGGGGGSKGGGAAKSTAEQRANNELRAQLELQKIALNEIEDTYKKVLGTAQKEFKKTGDAAAYVATRNQAIKDMVAGLLPVLAQLDALERQLLKDPTGSQSELLDKQQAARRKELRRSAVEDVNKTNEEIAAADQKLSEKRIEIAQKLADDLLDINFEQTERFVEDNESAWDQIIANEIAGSHQQNILRGEAYNSIKLSLESLRDAQINVIQDEETRRRKQIEDTIKDADEKYKLLGELDDLYKKKREIAEEEFQRRLKEIEEKYSVPVTPGEDKPMGGFFGGLFGGLGTSVEDALKPVETLNTLGQMLGSTFMQVAQAVGSAVKSFVLFGTAGGSFRKFAAEVLASIAQMAVVQAVFELAQGFAMLALTWFTGNPKFAASAGAHFTAAAAFGIIGGVAAIAGRVVAGDSFKKESSGAFGSASGGGQNRSGNGGSVFSGQSDMVVEESRNAPGGAGRGGILGAIQSHITLKIESTSAHIVEVVKQNINNNGQLRTVIQDAT